MAKANSFFLYLRQSALLVIKISSVKNAINRLQIFTRKSASSDQCVGTPNSFFWLGQPKLVSSHRIAQFIVVNCKRTSCIVFRQTIVSILSICFFDFRVWKCRSKLFGVLKSERRLRSECPKEIALGVLQVVQLPTIGMHTKCILNWYKNNIHIGVMHRDLKERNVHKQLKSVFKVNYHCHHILQT